MLSSSLGDVEQLRDEVSRPDLPIIPSFSPHWILPRTAMQFADAERTNLEIGPLLCEWNALLISFALVTLAA